MILRRVAVSRVPPMALLLVAAACAGTQGGSDAGTADGARDLDAGRIDGAVPDAGTDGGERDAGPGDGGIGILPAVEACRARSATIAAERPNVIRVSPAGDGLVNANGTTQTLRAVVSGATSGTTVLLEDGVYTLPEAGPGEYTGLYFTTPNVTLRSASGDASAVVLDAAYRELGGESAAITVAAPGVVISDLTVRRSVFHLVHLWSDGDRALLHDLRLEDGGQQFVKASPASGETVDDVEVSCSTFTMTPAGRENVWGYGPTDGSTTCYTGGIDTHGARRWHIHDSRFEGIYCDPAAAPHPAHGKRPDLRGGQTYTGGLAEYAIHMWDAEQGGGHLIERNWILSCARGIGLGMRAEVWDTVIRNNVVFSVHAASAEHDVGISLERAHDTQVDHNTVVFTSADAYPNAIEYRWDVSSGIEIRNNLTNQRIFARNGASATLAGNVEDAALAWFRDAATGDLHLVGCDLPSVVGAGVTLPTILDDVDGQDRGGRYDIGADHCVP